MKKTVKRYFSPLDQWIYIKVYINPVASNLVIINYLCPLINDLYPSLAKKWFFLRYFDTSYHLRLRFFFLNKKDNIKGLSIIQKHMDQAMNDGYVHKWMIDGYEREIERYGSDNIVNIENLFCINSIFVSKSLKYIAENTYLLNCLALWSMHNILEYFIKDNEMRANHCKKMMQLYFDEFHMSDDSRFCMNKSYRKYRSFLDSMNFEVKDGSKFLEDIKALQIENNKAIYTLISSLKEEEIRTLNFSSIIHLNINRFYQNNSRKIEMVLYYLLYKKYSTDKFRMKNY